MPERYIDAIMEYLSASRGEDAQPMKPRRLARKIGVGDSDYGEFREAVKRLRDSGRIVLGEGSALTLPQMASRVSGVYRANRRGFGFVVPDTPNAQGDLFIPRGGDGGALGGDHVLAVAKKGGKREGRTVYEGRIVEILKRGQGRFVGTLRQAAKTWFVLPDGKSVMPPIVIPDFSASPGQAKDGSKVVVEITRYPEKGEVPLGVITETLGREGKLKAETLAVIRAHGLEDKFSKQALAEARKAVHTFDPDDPAQVRGREDITAQTVITIDPPDARDYDDAISITTHRDGTVTLGVHIADVSHFVPEDGVLDEEARSRSTSVYLPRTVIPMLPEILSNGVCSLQEGQKRFCKSVFIKYDKEGNAVSSRTAETVIKSSKRLTYRQAQEICDGGKADCSPTVVRVVKQMLKLARSIEVRRRKQGMLHLDLPSVELVLDDKGRVTDAVPEDDSYTHTMIEMFMVEANEAVAATLDRLNVPFLRRIHPPPEADGNKQLGMFVSACGHKIPRDLTRGDIQALLESVRGKPESYAVNLAVLRIFQQAVYSPLKIGHFALAGEHYCHFTSPIRRYPDLTVHRLIAEHCRGTLSQRPPENTGELTKLAEHCSTAERRAEKAERELKEILVLQLLARKVGEDFDGVITGVTNFGMFVQMPRFLVEGLIPMDALGDDWWQVDAKRGAVRGERSGKTFRVGDMCPVRIASVDVASRQLNLMPQKTGSASAKSGRRRNIKKPAPATARRRRSRRK